LIKEKKHMEEKLYQVGEKVPAAGRYQCVVCGLVIEFLPKHIERGVTFLACPLCFAGTENGPKQAEEDVWMAI
jgi:rubrerythrin